MFRTLLPSPHYPERKICRLIPETESERQNWMSFCGGFNELPPGAKIYARWSGGMLEIGEEPIEEAKQREQKNAVDHLENKTLADLQTIAATKHIKYTPSTTASDLISAIREKEKKK